MKTIIVLAVHGSPPADFPCHELAEFFRLHSQHDERHGGTLKPHEERYHLLDKKMREWPRNAQNDPFYAASQELAAHISEVSGQEVIVGYNEFCSPGLEEALQSAAENGANKIIVATPMMTRGGEHAEKDIPAKISGFGRLYPQVEIVYAWPFDTTRVARFLCEHISRFV